MEGTSNVPRFNYIDISRPSWRVSNGGTKERGEVNVYISVGSINSTDYL